MGKDAPSRGNKKERLYDIKRGNRVSRRVYHKQATRRKEGCSIKRPPGGEKCVHQEPI